MKIQASPRVGVFMDKLVFGALPKIAREEVINLQQLGLNTSLLLIKRGDIDHEIENLQTDFLEDQSSILSKMGLKVPGFSFFSAFHLASALLAPKFNVRSNLLISHGTYTCFTAYGLRKIRGIPYFAYIYDPITYILRKVYSDASLKYVLAYLLPVARRLDKAIVNSSEAVILLSKYHLNSIKELTHKPVHIVYPGTDVVERVPSQRGKYLLSVARWERGKNPFFLLALLKNLTERGVRLTLVMEGPWKPPSLRTEFLRRAKKYGLQSDITLTGPSNRADLSSLYKRTRALIHPTQEAFGMTGLEAAAHGAPIIFPQGSGVTDLFTHGAQGYFPREGDLEAFTNNVQELTSDEPRAWRMGQAAWEVARNYTWKNHARALSKVLGFSGDS